MASNNFINECKTPAYEDRLGKILIDDVEYNQGNKLTSLTLENNIYNNGSIIGSTYTKSLKFSLIDVDKDTQFVGKKALPSVGVKYSNNTTEYIDLDEFTLEELNDEQTKNFTDITGYDALCDIDKPFTYTLGDGTHTVLEYWNNLVESLGLETETTSFTNDSIIIPANPFVNNESNRTVLSEIEKISCTFAKVEKRTRTVEGVTQTYHVINLVWFDENYEETTTIDGSGTLNNVSRLSDLKLQGNTTQAGTPTPSSPQPINVVSGRQEVSVCGKNFFNKNTAIRNKTFTSQNVVSDSTGLFISDYIKVKPNTAYYTNEYASVVIGLDKNKSPLGYIRNVSFAGTFTTGTTCEYIRIRSYNTTIDMETAISKAMVNEGTTSIPYETYTGQSYEINLGKNLINYNATGTGQDIDYNFNGSELSLNGTTSSSGQIAITSSQPITLPMGTYTFSSTTSGTFTANSKSTAIYLRKLSDNTGIITLAQNNNYTLTSTFTLTETTKVYVQIYTNGAGFVFDNFNIKWQIEKGNATDYTPYKTPIELCKIGTAQDFIKKGTGKNLLDIDGLSGTSNNVDYSVSNGVLILNGTLNGDRIEISLSNSLTIKGTYTFSKSYPSTISLKDSNYASILQVNGNLTEQTATVDSTITKIVIYQTNGTVFNNSGILLQVEKGTKTDFEPYGMYNKWYKEGKVCKVVLNGSESGWAVNGHIFYRSINNKKIGKLQIYCNNFTYSFLSWQLQPNYSISEDAYTNTIFIRDDDYSSVNDFKTWLSTHNTEVYYELATPTYTEITDEELINQLESIRLLKGINNIYINSGDLSSKTSLTYYLTNPDYEFTTGDYSTLEGSLTKYGPLNSIMLGRENIGGENVLMEDEESIALNGEHKILIDAEYFLFNQTLREQAIEAIYDKLDGFEYYDLSLTTYYGKPFLEVGDKIRVNTNEGNVYDTYILSHEFTYDGTFKSKIESPALTEQQEIVKTTESVSNRMRRTEIMVDKANGEITSLTTQTQEIQDDLAQNYYTSTQTNELIQTASTGLTNTFSEAGGNNIFRNTGLWFGAKTSKNTLFPKTDLYPSEDLFMGNEVVYEFWEGVVKRRKEDKASNMIAMVLQNGYLTQEQLVPNGKYTVSFKYNKLIALAVAKVFINDVEYPLNNVGDTEFIQIIEVNSQHINIKFYCSIDDGCEIYDLMVNAGEVKLAYSQNQNETTTDTVNISKGITITSSNLDVKFKADADGIRTLDNNDVEITKFTDTGMKTKEAIIEGKSQIVGTLWQEVGSQTWITRL